MHKLKVLYSIIFFALSFSMMARGADKALPTNLSESDRNKALEVLGFGTAARLLSSPFPLGGYSGIEIGLAKETIALDDLKRLGNKDSSLDEYNYYNLVVGKGLYYNLDVFLQFTPTLQNNSLTSYSGSLRWNFYESKDLPASMSFITYSGGASFSNLMSVTTLGADIVASMNMEDVSLYFGGGKVRAIGHFIGGDAGAGITDNGLNASSDILETHSLFGIMFRFAPFFLDFQVDRYVQSYYAGKIGLRF